MSSTPIEWTDATWNPVGGCSIESPGCIHCYAQKLAGTRLKHHPLYAGTTDRVKGKPVFNGRLTAAPTDHRVWQFPLSWRGAKHPVMGPNARSLIFVGDMSDLFHEDRSLGYALRVLEAGMHSTHILQLLTKRPARMLEFLRLWHDIGGPEEWEPKLARGPDAVRSVHACGRARLFADMLDTMGAPPPGCAYPLYDWMGGMAGWAGPFNVWFGFSAERQQEFDARWPAMREIAAMGHVVFCSYEPALGPLTLPADFLTLGRRAQLIAGGESGHDARPPHPDWFRSVRDQCAASGTAFFFKQWGEYMPVGQILPDYGKVHGATAVKSGRMKLHYGGTPKLTPKHAFAERGVEFASTADGRLTFRLGKARAGRMLDGREHSAFPRIAA